MKYAKVMVGMLLFAMVLTGCKSTPKEESVIQKDSDKMVEKATKRKGFSKIPDAIKINKFQSKDGTVQVETDAKVNLGDAESCPTVQISRTDFNEEDAKKYLAYFSEGKTLLKVQTHYTKSEIEDRIVQLKKEKEQFGDYKDEEGLYTKDRIKLLKKQLATAPEKDPEEAANTKLVNGGSKGGKRVLCYVKSGDRKGVIMVDDGYHGNEAIVSYTKFDNKITSYINDDLNEYMNKKMTLKKLNVSEKDALSQAEQLLNDLKINDFALNVTSRAYDQNVASIYQTSKQAVELENAYEFVFTRKVHGVQLNLNNTFTYFDRQDQKYDNVKNNEDNGNADYTEPWDEEKIVILVDDTGVIGFQYCNPFKEEKVITQNTSLMKFSQIKSIYKKMMLSRLQSSENQSTKVKIKNVYLSYERVMKKNSRTSAYIVPVWRFNGDIAVKSSENYKEKDVDLLKLNAIDGSVVETDENGVQ